MPDEPGSSSEYEFLPREEPKAEPEVPAPEPSAPPPVRPERLAADRICPHCGFEIFGKPRGGRCPDCAAPLDLHSSDLLQFADGDWVKGLSNGVLFIALAVALDVAAVAIRWCDLKTPGLLAHLLAGAIAVLGIWWATAKEEGLSPAASPTAIPARVVSVAIFVLWIVIVLGSLWEWTGALKTLTIVVLFAYGAEALLVGFHLQKLALRVPNDDLAAHCLNLAWLMPGFCLVLVAVNAFNLAIPQVMILFFCAFPLIGGLLVMILWTLMILIRLGLELRNAAVAGESIAIRKAQRLAAKR